MRNGKSITLAVLLAASGVALAQQANRPAQDTHGQMLSSDEKDIIKMLHEANRAEMEMGALARSNAGSKDVKDYGRMLEQDHGKADQQLVRLASQKKMQMQMEMPKTEAKDASELRALKGDAFDQKFLQLMVDAHTKKIDELTSRMTDVKDPQLKSMVKDTLPILQHHRDRAQALLAKKTG